LAGVVSSTRCARRRAVSLGAAGPGRPQRVRLNCVAQPIFFVLTGDQAVLGGLTADLERRFGTEYRILAASSSATALRMLEEAASAGQPVALIFADQRLSEMAAVDFLGRGRALHQAAKRILIIE
jgi:thioredoxin reductase (NADPH)